MAAWVNQESGWSTGIVPSQGIPLLHWVAAQKHGGSQNSRKAWCTHQIWLLCQFLSLLCIILIEKGIEGPSVKFHVLDTALRMQKWLTQLLPLRNSSSGESQRQDESVLRYRYREGLWKTGMTNFNLGHGIMGRTGRIRKGFTKREFKEKCFCIHCSLTTSNSVA